MATETIKATLMEAQMALEALIANDEAIAAVDCASKAMAQAISSGHKILSCGNGGSLCDSMHFAEEMTGRFRQDRPGFAAIAIADASHMSCVGNDYGYEEVFARYNASVGDNMRATEHFETDKNPNLAGRIVAADYVFPFAADAVTEGAPFTVEYEKKGETVREDVAGKIYGVSSASDGRLVMRLAAGNVTLRPDRVFRTLKESVQSCGALTDTVKTAQYAACEGGFVDVDDLLRKGDRAGGPAGAPSMTK